MGVAFKGILATVWLLILPTASGAVFIRKKNIYTFGECFLAGYLFLFAASEIMILPMLFARLPLHFLVIVYAIVQVTVAAMGGWQIYKRRQKILKVDWKGIKKSSLFLWIAVIIIGIQIYFVTRYAHMDADDSFYVGVASTAVYTDTIFSVNPYTGSIIHSLPSRYVLSPFPVFLAVVSQLCAGLHPAIMAHMIFPAVFFLMAYLVVFLISKKWFGRDKSAQGIFLIIVATLNWFSAYSVYNTGNFQMVRIWQGKALLAAAFLPITFHLCQSIMLEKKSEYSWLLLGMANLGCCLLSSMGIILAPLVIGCFLPVSLVRFRDIKRVFAGVLCCVPSVCLGIVYLFIK